MVPTERDPQRLDELMEAWAKAKNDEDDEVLRSVEERIESGEMGPFKAPPLVPENVSRVERPRDDRQRHGSVMLAAAAAVLVALGVSVWGWWSTETALHELQAGSRQRVGLRLFSEALAGEGAGEGTEITLRLGEMEALEAVGHGYALFAGRRYAEAATVFQSAAEGFATVHARVATLFAVGTCQKAMADEQGDIEDAIRGHDACIGTYEKIRRLLEQAPRADFLAMAHHFIAWSRHRQAQLLVEAGRRAEARRMIEEAEVHYQAALGAARGYVKVDYNRALLSRLEARLALAQGEAAEAERLRAQAAERFAAAEGALEEKARRDPTDGKSLFVLAQVRAAQGGREEAALEALGKALDVDPGLVVLLPSELVFEGLRHHPRYLEIKREASEKPFEGKPSNIFFDEELATRGR